MGHIKSCKRISMKTIDKEKCHVFGEFFVHPGAVGIVRGGEGAKSSSKGC